MKRRGRGVAATIYPTNAAARSVSAVYLHVREDGSINLSTGCTEIGQGANTVLAQILAEELGVSIEEINIISGDTENCPQDWGAVSSRQTHMAGNAVRAAAQEIKRILQDTVCELLECNPEDLVFGKGGIYVSGSSEKFVSFKDAVAETYSKRRIALIAEGWHVSNTSDGIDPETGRGEPYPAHEYQAVVVDVEVDTETGLVEVLNVYAATEAGRIINPLLSEAQVEGGIMQGIGFGLRESFIPYFPEIDNLSPNYNPFVQPNNLADYLIATALDTPVLHESLIDYPDPVGPYGAVGLGEFSANCVGAAIANAIHDAIGIRIYSAPCTPERILAELRRCSA